MQLVVLAGGVGGGRFLSGLIHCVPAANVIAVVNTGDDAIFHGLHISPDIDIVTYTLAGIVEENQGWGIVDDTFNCLNMLGKLGHQTWFGLGDKDLAVHIHRTQKLNQGYTLAQVTDDIRESMGVACRILPMSNEPVRTLIDTGAEVIPFQEYFVKRKCQDVVRKIIYEGIERAEPSPGVLEAIQEATAVIIAPSNPFLSIESILSLKSMRVVIDEAHARVIAISPIIGGKTVKGPADKIMKSLGYEVSALGIARIYQDILDAMVIDRKDRSQQGDIEALGIEVCVIDTFMNTMEKRVSLANAVLKML